MVKTHQRKGFVLSFILLGGFITALSGCGGAFKMTALVSTLMDIATMERVSSHVNADVVLADLSDDADIAFLQTTLEGFTNLRRVNYQGSSTLAFSIRVPIICRENAGNFDFSKDLLYLQADEQNDAFSFSFQVNEGLFNTLNEYVEDNYSVPMDYRSFDVAITVQNDREEPITLTGYSVYVSGDPYPQEYLTELEAGNRVTVTLSEILRSAVVRNPYDSFPVFSISK